MFSDILGSIDVSVKIAVSNKVMTGGGTLSEDVGSRIDCDRMYRIAGARGYRVA